MGLQVYERTKGEYTNTSIKPSDLGNGDSFTYQFTTRVPNDKSRYEGMAFVGTGTFGKWYLYEGEVIEPKLGKCSFFASNGLHTTLLNFQPGDTVKITKIKKKGVKGDFTAYTVEKVVIAMTEEDKQKVIAAIKAIPEKMSEDKLVELLVEFGCSRDQDIKEIIERVRS